MAGRHVCPATATSPTPPLRLGGANLVNWTRTVRPRLRDTLADPALDPPTLPPTPLRPVPCRASGRPPAPSHPSSLSRCETRTSIQAAAPPLRTAATPPSSTNPPLPPFFPVGAQTGCTVHRPGPFK
jgi:hypothetical protein